MFQAPHNLIMAVVLALVAVIFSQEKSKTNLNRELDDVHDAFSEYKEQQRSLDKTESADVFQNLQPEYSTGSIEANPRRSIIIEV